MSTVEKIYDLGLPHNKFSIVLPDGTYYPDFITRIDERPREFLDNYDRIRTKPWAECSFLDLGCSEGSTTLALGQMGSTVYGVEGRADGVQRALALKEILDVANVEFRVENVNDAAAFREVDGIFNAGILYHLDRPLEFLIRTCENAREFVYLDTGHAPVDEAELRASKFVNNFGKRYTLSFKGLSLDVIDFAEPGDTRERDEKGRRRGPRSGIGNSNSVWLTHDSTIDFMRAMGFEHHEKVHYTPIIPRRRTCFFRTAPRPKAPRLAFTNPLPRPLPRDQAVARTMERDLAYLRRAGLPVTVIGPEPGLSRVAGHLRSHGVGDVSAVALRVGDGGKVSLAALEAAVADRRGIVALAVAQPLQLMRKLVKLDQFSVALTSFGLALCADVEAAPSRERAGA